jgi:hypothetical protein
MSYSLLAFGGAVTVVTAACGAADDDAAPPVDVPLGSDWGLDDVQAAIGKASVMTLATNTRRFRFMDFPFVVNLAGTLCG